MDILYGYMHLKTNINYYIIKLFTNRIKYEYNSINYYVLNLYIIILRSFIKQQMKC